MLPTTALECRRDLCPPLLPSIPLSRCHPHHQHQQQQQQQWQWRASLVQPSPLSLPSPPPLSPLPSLLPLQPACSTVICPRLRILTPLGRQKLPQRLPLLYPSATTACRMLLRRFVPWRLSHLCSLRLSRATRSLQPRWPLLLPLPLLTESDPAICQHHVDDLGGGSSRGCCFAVGGCKPDGCKHDGGKCYEPDERRQSPFCSGRRRRRVGVREQCTASPPASAGSGTGRSTVC